MIEELAEEEDAVLQSDGENELEEEIQAILRDSSTGEDRMNAEENHDDSILASMLSPININQQISTDADDLFKLLLNIHGLLHRVRKTVRLIRKSSLIESYVREQMKNVGQVKQLIGDCHIRWNSTAAMVNRFLLFKDIVSGITTTPDRINGLTKSQKDQLKKLFLSQFDWETIEALNIVLEPFVLATQVLSGRQYATLGLGFVVFRSLDYFLAPCESDLPLVASMKRSLRYHFNVYFDKHISDNQRNLMLVSISQSY